MVRLHYHRWLEQFVKDEFSSEDSMRDYLSSNPGLIFEEHSWVIPIQEEKFLPGSSLVKESGRADIILCRIMEEKDKVRKEEKLQLSSIELWIVELKKVESSYENGFMQLFDYMTVVKNNFELQNDIVGQIKKRIEKDCGKKIELGDDPNVRFAGIYGSLVAPSFDLISRMREPVSRDIKKNYKQDWEILEKKLKDKGKKAEGFTLIDAVHALFPDVTLIKLIRFKRGDEVIIYSENILGKKAITQTSRIDPKELFLNHIIKEDDVFYFRDDKGVDHKEVECRVLNKRGRSHSFMIEVVAPKGDPIEIPKYVKAPKPHYEYTKKTIPIENTTKTCSMALHKVFKIYDDEELIKYYWNFGEKNFVKKNGKNLFDLKEEYRLSIE